MSIVRIKPQITSQYANNLTFNKAMIMILYMKIYGKELDVIKNTKEESIIFWTLEKLHVYSYLWIERKYFGQLVE